MLLVALFLIIIQIFPLQFRYVVFVSSDISLCKISIFVMPEDTLKFFKVLLYSKYLEEFDQIPHYHP